MCSPASRGKKEIAAQLAGFAGVLQVDGYAAYKSLAGREAVEGRIVLAYCLAHARRKFVKCHKTTKSPFAKEVIERIAAVYAIEKRIRGDDADQRRAVRQAREPKPLMEALHGSSRSGAATGCRGSSTLTKAIDYMLDHGAG